MKKQFTTINHKFDVAHARVIGLIPAIVLHQIEFMLRTDPKFTRVRDGRRYYRMSVKKLQEHKFQYLTEKQLRKAFDFLESNGFLLSYQDNGFQRTKMYCLGDGASLKINSEEYPEEFKVGLPQDSECELDQDEIDDYQRLPSGANAIDLQGESIFPTGRINMPSGANLNKEVINKEVINKEVPPMSPEGGSQPSTEVKSKPSRSKKTFVRDQPPTLDEVVENVRSTDKRNVNPYTFFAHHTDPAINWSDKNGRPYADWKRLLATWNNASWAVPVWKSDPTELAVGKFAPKPPEAEDYMTPQEIEICKENLDNLSYGLPLKEYPKGYYEWKKAVAEHKSKNTPK